MINLTRDGAVLEIEMDRPPVNAINIELSTAMYDALQLLQNDDDCGTGS
jgi:enoyl-CoA hydratase/carnithine racemase